MSSFAMTICLFSIALFGAYTLFKLFIPENNDIYW